MVRNYGITIEIDEQYAPLVDAKDLETAVETALALSAALTGEVTLVITDDEAVQELNRTYRDVDAPTDVLSFASQEASQTEAPSLILPPELAEVLNAHLGDVIIAFPYAGRQSARYGNDIAAELRLLAVHGVLHLLGYDHDTADAEAEMWAQQEKILRTFGDQALARRDYGE